MSQDKTSPEVMHGWHSQKMERTAGYSIYKNAAGESVQITLVNDSSSNHYSGWDDMVYVGEVLDFVSSNRLT